MKAYRVAVLGLLVAASLAAQAPKKHPAGSGKHPSAPGNPPSAPSGSGQPCVVHPGCSNTKPIKKGVERWPIKVSLPGSLDLTKTQTVPIASLLALGDATGVAQNDSRFQDARIPAPASPLNAKEGDLVKVKGWLWLIALEDDGDYHIQISASAQSGDHCLIAELPNPDPAFDASPALRPTFQQVRDFLKAKTLKNQDPSRCGSVMGHPPYVEVIGQLFFDDSHVGATQARGKKCMHAATLWELHPVVAMKFAPKPAP